MPLIMEAPSRAYWEHVRASIVAGIGLATVLSLLVSVLSVLRGSTAFPRLGLTLPTVVSLYYAGCITAGAIVGLLRPLARRAVGAMVVGALAILPAYAMLDLTRYDGPLADWPSTRLPQVLLICVTAGPLWGYLAWRRYIRPADKQRKRD